MITQFTTPSLLILSTLLVGALNLTSPYATQKDSFIRNFLLITIAIFFFGNILIIDWLFLKGIRAGFEFNIFGNYSIGFHLEPLGLIFLSLIGFLWICALLYTPKYLAINNIEHSSRFLFFFNLTILTGVLIALSSNLFTMFICYELLTISTAFLIGHTKNNIVLILSGLYKYLKILMISATILFLPAVIILYTKVGNGNFASGSLVENYFSKNQSIILLLMFIFGIAKTAIFPVHSWLPAAMVAHYPVSSLLHAVIVVKTGLFCIYKILLYIFGLSYLQMIFAEFNWLIFIPIVSIFYSSIKALGTDNIKKILAYSTMNQLSIALLSALMLTPKALGAAILHLVSHSFSKICLFYSMGSIYSLKKADQIQNLHGVSKEFPLISFIISISSLSLIGIPIFSGFISKFSILLAASEQNQIIVMIVIIASSIFSSLYLLKILSSIYKPSLVESSVIKSLPYSMQISIIICCCAVTLFYFIQILIREFLAYIT
ncbi:proton-conducting transporter transmembrane domain-containing protein [Rickettsia tamurae]|uniref:proton-conducting transporter transmembrane domain-containing protein n=1 Tax=Rickettsia tamurae TaxID=334545 RepID=UPI00050A0D0F|nr:proton-conducting transporter membrane subunit [Rickettsia tamurae]